MDTLIHFKELYRIARQDGLYHALDYDLHLTQNRHPTIMKALDAIIEAAYYTQPSSLDPKLRCFDHPIDPEYKFP